MLLLLFSFLLLLYIIDLLFYLWFLCFRIFIDKFNDSLFIFIDFLCIVVVVVKSLPFFSYSTQFLFFLLILTILFPILFIIYMYIKKMSCINQILLEFYKFVSLSFFVR